MKKHATLLTFSILLISLSLLSLVIGYSKLGLMDLLATISGQANSATQLIFWKIRLPRLIVSILAGGALAMSGHLFQTLTRNSLADSGILGVNAGAGLLLTLALTWNITFPLSQPLLALIGGFLASGLVYLLAYKNGQALNPTRLVLTGVGLASLFSSCMISLMVRFDRYQLDTMIGWLSGRYVGDDWQTINLISPLLIALCVLSWLRFSKLNILRLEASLGIGLGLDRQKEATIVLILATSLASFSSLLVGNTAFIGLLAGHLAKRLIGNQHQYSLPLSALIGSSLLISADIFSRSLLVGTGIPTGLVITLIGAPYFLFLLYSDKHSST
ncbi:FecCD family ABC transporter permease [Streptococcus suis]|uniref:FecCD family ABC transporter permease n=1 Tax=Streptococcus suis TaxID=1307 RepID=UPI001374A888|nr:iron ABC transporter permease [Streptococcus suis]HEM2810203.1 iron ABC transporter permease [Streptococcus suis]